MVHSSGSPSLGNNTSTENALSFTDFKNNLSCIISVVSYRELYLASSKPEDAKECPTLARDQRFSIGAPWDAILEILIQWVL